MLRDLRQRDGGPVAHAGVVRVEEPEDEVEGLALDVPAEVGLLERALERPERVVVDGGERAGDLELDEPVRLRAGPEEGGDGGHRGAPVLWQRRPHERAHAAGQRGTAHPRRHGGAGAEVRRYRAQDACDAARPKDPPERRDVARLALAQHHVRDYRLCEQRGHVPREHGVLLRRKCRSHRTAAAIIIIIGGSGCGLSPR